MKLIQLIDEDFLNYKKACMIIGMPYCSFKCDKECGQQVCQNSALADAPIIEIDNDKLIERYLNNPITEAVCFQGLEPLDSYKEVIDFIHLLRYKYKCSDDIIIYTGYTERELRNVNRHPNSWGYNNIIIKFGRFIPNQKSHYDKVLGVTLASPNQYAVKFPLDKVTAI